MNTTHLKYFYDVYRLESVVTAARANNVAPSTVSQAIRALEIEFGHELTQKKRGELILTEKALLLLQKIPAVLSKIDELKTSLVPSKSELEGILRIGTHQSLLSSHLWMPIRTYKRKYPKVDLNVMTGMGPLLSDLLIRNQMDVMISLEQPGRGNDLKSTLLYEGTFLIVGQHSSNFAKKTPVVVTSKTKAEVQYLLRNNPSLEVEELTNWSTIKSVIMNEDAFGFLPDYLVQKELREGTLHKVSKIKKQDFKFRIYSWYRKESASNPVIAKFNELAESSFRRPSK